MPPQVLRLQEREQRRIERWGAQGLEPWRTFLSHGLAARAARDRAWLAGWRASPARS
jgi:hypothetical protein